MSSTPTSAPPTTSPSPPPWPASRWSSWSSTCWPPGGPGPWSASDAPLADRQDHPAAGHGRGPGLRLRPPAGRGDQLLQLRPRGRLAPRRLHRLLVVLPIALPGIVTGIALQSAFRFLGIPLSLWTIVVGHATFCIVVVFNNTLARLRRMSSSLEEASMDLGADGVQTFRLVTFPTLRSALLAGALLAFALSFDEIIVTTFTAGAGDQTLPIWIFTNLTRPNQAPVVNVVAVLLILISVIPIWLAQRLSEGTVRGGAGAAAR